MRAWLVEARGGRSQREVAKQAGIGQSYYSMIENGIRMPSVRAAQRIGHVLKVDWRAFFEEAGAWKNPADAGREVEE